MASPITSFQEAQGPSQGSNASTEASINIDKFATLFSPATPRASPTLEPIDADPVLPMTYSRPRSYHRDRRDTLGSDSELGSFVSVSATDDPLSALGFVLPAPTEALSSSTNANDADYNRKNSSLRFFGKFAQEAKEAAERNKRGVLDELLLHEDDPLYWLKDQGQELASGSSDTQWPPSQPSEGETESPPPEQSREGLDAHSDASSSLLDLDHDFFASKPLHNSTSSLPNNTHAPTSMPHHSPNRSPTHPAPATLAPLSPAPPPHPPHQRARPLTHYPTTARLGSTILHGGLIHTRPFPAFPRACSPPSPAPSISHQAQADRPRWKHSSAPRRPPTGLAVANNGHGATTHIRTPCATHKL